MDKSQGNEPRDTVYSVEESIQVQGENEQEEEDLEDRRRREAELHNIISTRLGNISYDDDQSINSTSFDSTSTSRYQSNPVGDAYKDASLNSFEQLQIMYEARVKEQNELRKTIDEMKIQHKADSDEITRKVYVLEADFNRVQFLYEQAQEVLDEKNIEIKEKETRLAELTQIVTDLTASRNQLQAELLSWKETHCALEQKLQIIERGLTQNLSEKEIRQHYEQQFSKLQESILVATKKYENAESEIKVLKERIVDYDENEKELVSQIKVNEQAEVCVRCTDFLNEINKFEVNMGVVHEAKDAKLTPGTTITHDQYEETLKQFLNSLRQLDEDFADPEEVKKLQAEVAVLAQTVVDLKSHYLDMKSDEEKLKQKDVDIADLKDIIMKLQNENNMVNKDMKDAILSLQEKESNVIELKQSLQQLTEKETKFKLEQEKLQSEDKTTAEEEVDTLDKMIEALHKLAHNLRYQVEQIKMFGNNECDEQLSVVLAVIKKLKEANNELQNESTLKMSADDAGNRKVAAFAQKVAQVNQFRNESEEDLTLQLATFIETCVTKEAYGKKLVQILDELSDGNAGLQHELTAKSQEQFLMEANKNNEIWNLQNKLERMTVEKIEAEKRIVSKDEEIIRLKNKIKEGSSVETSTLPDMPYLGDPAELKRLSDLINEKSCEVFDLRKKLRLSEPADKSPLSKKPKTGDKEADSKTEKQINPDLGTSGKKHLKAKENDPEYNELLERYNKQQTYVEKLYNKVRDLKMKLKELAKVYPRRLHLDEENLRLQGKNANLNSELTAAQIQIIEMSDKIEQFESQGELIEDMKKKSHIFQEYMNEQITLRLSQRGANAAAVTNTATNTSDVADKSIDEENKAQKVEMLNSILEKKNEHFQILLDENKCLKEKIVFDRTALNELTEAWYTEINRLKLVADTSNEKNAELEEKVKTLSKNIALWQGQFMCLTSKLCCANEVFNRFEEALEEQSKPDMRILFDGLVGLLDALKNKVCNCLEKAKHLD